MITICLCGTGQIGRLLLRHIEEHKDAQIIAIVEQDANLAKNLGYPVYSTFSEALEKHSCDAVVIATPVDTHPDLIDLAAEKGKAIFCDRAIGYRLSPVEECLIEAAHASNPLVVGLNHRFDPALAKLHDLVQNGAIGEVEMLYITSYLPKPSLPEHTSSFGMLYETTLYDMDMALWLMSEQPTQVFTAASCLQDPIRTQPNEIDTAMITLKAANGKLCHISSSRQDHYGSQQKVEVCGSKGVLRSWEILPEQQVLSGSLQDAFLFRRYSESYKREIQHFIDVLQGKAKPLVSGEDSLQALLLSEAAHESYLHGCVINARQLTPFNQ